MTRARKRWTIRTGEAGVSNFAHQPVLVPCALEATLQRIASYQLGPRPMAKFSPWHTFAGFPDREAATAYVAAKLEAMTSA